MLSDDELPELPDASAPLRYICTECGYVGEVGPAHIMPSHEACGYLALTIPAMFDADQMREYARAVKRAAYERAAQECDQIEDGEHEGHKTAGVAWECADAIRALGRQHD